MLLGHCSIALAAKKAAPRVSLGVLFLAAQFLDVLWPLFLLTGLESVKVEPGNTVVKPLKFEHYPFTHSLAAVLGWAVLVGGTYWIFRRKVKDAVVLGVLVTSHWFLDLIGRGTGRGHGRCGDSRVSWRFCMRPMSSVARRRTTAW